METVPDGGIEDGSLCAGELILLELAVAVDVGASKADMYAMFDSLTILRISCWDNFLNTH